MPPTDLPQGTVNNVWGSSVAEGTTVFLTTPSGQTCHAERMGLPGLVKAGVLGEADSLTAFVDKKHIKRVRGGKGVEDHDEVNMESILKDPDQLGKIIMLVDRTLPLVVKDPIVRKHFVDLDKPDEGGNLTRRIPDDERESGVVYTDQIGLEDKMYLFNWTVGGTADAERFSDQTAGAVATVEHGQGVPRSTKRASRSKGSKRNR
jgi:hypothetical protein